MLSTVKCSFIAIAAMALVQTSCHREQDALPVPAPADDDRATGFDPGSQQAGDQARNLARDDDDDDDDNNDHDDLATALASTADVRIELQAARGSALSGTVYLDQEDDGVLITAMVDGLQPGEHGFHIHETGDCSAADFSSAGGHFNPTSAEHGAPFDRTHHLGDLGNLVTNQRGRAVFAMHLPGATLDRDDAEGRHSIAGKAFVIHQGTDDLETDPAGAASARIACGVVPNG